MSQPALASPDLDRSEARPTATRRPRRKRLAVLAGLSLLLTVILAVGILVFSPPVLEALSAMVLPPEAGAVPWNGSDRITVVAMGLTQRTTEPARTDTLLVMDINPSTRHVEMLSVPRDLWVNIPGYGYGKIAIAYEIGGPRLAAYTLERALGIPVDYTLGMTFHGFINVINAMGGVNVNVPQELNDPSYPCLVGTGYCPIDIKAGPQHMSGATALEFVRERHAFAQQDLARVKDQQAFTGAVKSTLISPLTWFRYPALLSALKQGLITNMPLNDLPAVGVQFLMARGSQVHHTYINIQNGMVTPSTSNDGQSILLPTNQTVIPNLVHRLFSDPAIASENASVAVLNGTSVPGEATDVQGTLQGLGFRTVLAGNAANQTYSQSQVVINSNASGPADYTGRRLQRIMNATLVHAPVPGQSARIVVIVGSDFPTG